MDSITLGSADALHIHTVDNNEMNNDRDVYFEQTPSGLRTDLILAGGCAEPVAQFANGRPLIVSADSSVVEWSADFCHACSPREIPIVLAWNGSRYTVETKRYPNFSRVAARNAWYKAAQCIRNDKLGDYGAHTYIAGYYANMLTIGEGRFAYRWLMRRIPSSTKSWLREYAPEFRRKVSCPCFGATA